MVMNSLCTIPRGRCHSGATPARKSRSRLHVVRNPLQTARQRRLTIPGRHTASRGIRSFFCRFTSAPVCDTLFANFQRVATTPGRFGCYSRCCVDHEWSTPFRAYPVYRNSTFSLTEKWSPAILNPRSKGHQARGRGRGIAMTEVNHAPVPSRSTRIGESGAMGASQETDEGALSRTIEGCSSSKTPPALVPTVRRGNAFFGISLRRYGNHISSPDFCFTPLEIMPNGYHIRRRVVKQSFTFCIPKQSLGTSAKNPQAARAESMWSNVQLAGKARYSPMTYIFQSLFIVIAISGIAFAEATVLPALSVSAVAIENPIAQGEPLFVKLKVTRGNDGISQPVTVSLSSYWGQTTPPSCGPMPPTAGPLP